MLIADNILRDRLKNVYFIWGSGKTTAANKLHEKYGFYIYSTDAGRDINFRKADPLYQPYMCRDYVKEYNVRSFWELPSDVIADRELHFLNEVTPMLIADLLVLAAHNNIVICEGDIDYKSILPLTNNIVYLLNIGQKYDWFNRPDHSDALESINKRNDLNFNDKQEIINKAYETASSWDNSLPNWVIEHGIKYIKWDNNTDPIKTADEIVHYFGLI